ncbi:hypothetical protein AVEN_248113-1 [Araneus ventricosus]|uniref:Uncharacterized protein n=1 Tax=Araneus ventricosus TaxID=182803 RepID=A0A4Y2NCT1_ARAVE|nr:hypothetical protein AVEN_248113-1 [Araneus ventricosus]
MIIIKIPAPFQLSRGNAITSSKQRGAFFGPFLQNKELNSSEGKRVQKKSIRRMRRSFHALIKSERMKLLSIVSQLLCSGDNLQKNVMERLFKAKYS